MMETIFNIYLFISNHMILPQDPTPSVTYQSVKKYI